MTYSFNLYDFETSRELIKETFGNRKNWERYKVVRGEIWMKCYLDSFNYCRTC